MVGEASAFCVHPSGLFVTNHHAIRNVLPPTVIDAIAQSPTPGRRTRTTSPARDHIPIAIPPEARPRIDLILNSNRPDQKILPARVLWTDPDWDLALLRAEGTGDLSALPIAPESALAGLGEVVAFGFPLGQDLAVQAHDPAVNVTRGKVLQVAATDGQPGEIVAQLSISPGNSGGPLVDKRGLVVGVIRARLEDRASGKGVSLAIPVNRLERFLSRPEITLFVPRIVDRAAAGRPVE
jgi:S1-C subfamily serine protease